MPSPKYRREMPQRYRLEAEKCRKCSKVFFPPRLVCSGCGSRDFEKIRLPDKGEIVTFTTIRVAPTPFATEVPYNIAIVQFDGGGKITTQVVDCKPEDIEIGKQVKLVFRKLNSEGKTGIIRYGYKAVLV